MHEKHSGHEAESLAVTSLRIQHGVGIQDVVERLLAALLQPAGEVGVGGERTAWKRGEDREREGRERGVGERGEGRGGEGRGGEGRGDRLFRVSILLGTKDPSEPKISVTQRKGQ